MRNITAGPEQKKKNRNAEKKKPYFNISMYKEKEGRMNIVQPLFLRSIIIRPNCKVLST